MFTTLVDTKPHNWSASVFVRQPVEATLTSRPHAPVTPLHNAAALKPVTRPTYHAPTPPEGYAEVDCPWFGDDYEPRWADEVILSFQSPDAPVLLLSAWSVTTELPAAKVNAAPLVSAAAKKESPVLLKIDPKNDCLHAVAVAEPVAPKAPKPAEPEPEYWMAGVRKYCKPYGRIPIPTPCPDDLDGPVLRRIDGRTGKAVEQ